MTLGPRSIAPIIAAASADEAHTKALYLADDLVQRRLPWLMEGGRHKPIRAVDVRVEIGEPVQLHRARSHR